jgi:hypothetical protein
LPDSSDQIYDSRTAASSKLQKICKPYEVSGEEVNIIGRIRWFAREI